MNKITMQAIANEMKLSKSLVSKALSNQAGVNEETKERIRLTAIRLGYRINSSIMSVSSSRTGNIAILIPKEDMEDFEYWGKVIRGIEKGLSEKSFSMILSAIDTSLTPSDGMPSCIQDRKVDGAIVLGFVPQSYIQVVQQMGLPVVMVDSSSTQLKFDHVLVENYLGSYEATRYLLDRNHTAIGFVGDIDYAASFAERYRGFAKCISDFNFEKHKKIKEYAYTQSRGSRSIPFNLLQLQSALSGPDKPSALVCANDPVAFEVMQLLTRLGLRCPEDISLIGFDNLQKCEWTTPALTSVDGGKDTMGSRAVLLMFRRMNESMTRSEHIMITTEIVERQSVRVIPDEH
ncbi:LacI family transcriptional regulator [Paenibacillus psychroresistens]|uniref:LacI family transcriptional regulator n=1 Tax=Paenibacillus psychroresistens TaxID=1778678 RepID=A0A6B8RQW1_9BACL|nr:LacI family DNA-binding transcriptional regulator [Paenibacillus psychroresistens]QGQ97766.1 LacI family transcriptional regulator [Paenibacillus psychroresistens]